MREEMIEVEWEIDGFQGQQVTYIYPDDCRVDDDSDDIREHILAMVDQDFRDGIDFSVKNMAEAIKKIQEALVR
jgi:hypothetical protein